MWVYLHSLQRGQIASAVVAAQTGTDGHGLLQQRQQLWIFFEGAAGEREDVCRGGSRVPGKLRLRAVMVHSMVGIVCIVVIVIVFILSIRTAAPL